MNFLNVSKYSTSAGATSVLVLDGNNVVKYRTASEIVSDGGVASTVGKIYIATAESGWAMTIAQSNNPGTAVPVGDVRRFVVGFKPTNFRLSFWQYTTGNNNVGMRAQFSTSSTDWSAAVNSDIVYALTDAGADSIRTGTGTISLSGSAPYYVRFLMYNNSGSSQSLSIKDLTLELWN
jgi:hypothetical protein